MATVWQKITAALEPIYGSTEAQYMAKMIMEKLGNGDSSTWKNVQETELSDPQQEQLATYLEQLQNHRPIQYVLNEAWFQSMPFRVDERVLIPRPETEELVEWVAVAETGHQPISILDLGTGSGCIAISLKKRLPHATVTAADISESALELARENATALNVDLDFIAIDFLQEAQWPLLPEIHVLVSNPPYIPVQERAGMSKHVIAFEPSQALFVPNDDALVFYRALAKYCMEKAAPGCRLYVEIHEELGQQVLDLFRQLGLQQISLKQDMQGKDRMVRAVKP